MAHWEHLPRVTFFRFRSRTLPWADCNCLFEAWHCIRSNAIGASPLRGRKSQEAHLRQMRTTSTDYRLAFHGNATPITASLRSNDNVLVGLKAQIHLAQGNTLGKHMIFTYQRPVWAAA